MDEYINMQLKYCNMLYLQNMHISRLSISSDHRNNIEYFKTKHAGGYLVLLLGFQVFLLSHISEILTAISRINEPILGIFVLI